jgi:hypothetical protein
MRIRFALVSGMIAALTIGACSSSRDDKPASASASNAASTASNSAGVVETENANALGLANGPADAAQNGDANANTAASADQMPQGPMSKRLEEMRKAGEGMQSVDPKALAMKNAKPAPDNSTFTSYLTDAGYEIRQFKNHPQLLRVEKKIESNGEQSVKVFLRTGTVVQLQGNAIPILSTASADAIASAAGIAAAPAKVPSTGPTGAKKQGN